MQNWYVVQVLSTHEKKVKKALEEQSDLKSKQLHRTGGAAYRKCVGGEKRPAKSCRKKALARIPARQNGSERRIVALCKNTRLA